jgi:dipeptidyl aminopeptidase/acylaminoacyl peptidase
MSRSALSAMGGWLYWCESRPAEGGRTVLVRGRPGTAPQPISNAPASLRSRVHEYGGGAYALVPGASAEAVPTIVGVDQADQLVQVFCPASPPRLLGTLAPPGEQWRHGDLCVLADASGVLAVRERRRGTHVIHEIVALSAGDDPTTVLCSGRQFYAAPRPTPDGRLVAWVCWDHPHMPWDQSELWVGHLYRDAGGMHVSEPRRISGGPGVSVGQPLWRADGSLSFVSDEAGWWQPWSWRPGSRAFRLNDRAAEFHAPDWSLGQRTMAEVGGVLYARVHLEGRDHLARIDDAGGPLAIVEQPCVSISAVCAEGADLAWIGASTTEEAAIFHGTLRGNVMESPGRLSEPSGVPHVAITTTPSIATPYVCENDAGQEVHALVYLPPELPAAPPPLVVSVHSGPTGMADAGYDPFVQLITSQGYALAAVNYGGSTGYGRAYRERLSHNWGIVDVDDCVAVAVALGACGIVDPARMAIRGTSAGGFSTLSALARTEVFVGGVAWYPLTDLVSIARSGHDFEAHYTDALVGPWPEAVDLLAARSPLHMVADIDAPILLCHGTEDPVVPISQAEAFAEEMRSRRCRCELVRIEGEGHGFRRLESLERALVAELEFYAACFGVGLGGVER